MGNVTFLEILMLVLGIFVFVAGGVIDADFMYTTRRAKNLVAMIGRKGTRIFYLILGGIIIFLSIKRYF